MKLTALKKHLNNHSENVYISIVEVKKLVVYIYISYIDMKVSARHPLYMKMVWAHRVHNGQALH